MANNDKIVLCKNSIVFFIGQLHSLPHSINFQIFFENGLSRYPVSIKCYQSNHTTPVTLPFMVAIKNICERIYDYVMNFVRFFRFDVNRMLVFAAAIRSRIVKFILDSISTEMTDSCAFNGLISDEVYLAN